MNSKIIEPSPIRKIFEIKDNKGVIQKISTWQYPYCVYVLYFEDTPVYAGMTNNIINRINIHKRDKKFDSYIVIAYDQDKKICRKIEMAVIAVLDSINKNLLNLDVPEIGSPIKIKKNIKF